MLSLKSSVVLLLALAGAASAAPKRKNTVPTKPAIRQKGVHYKDGIFPAPKVEELAAASSNGLTYYGGPVIANIDVHPIYYGGNVNYQSQMDTFYGAIVGSPYISWLSEYNTPTQNIGTGTFSGSITQNSGLSTSTSDASIQTWLRGLVQSGTLKPTTNTYYPIHFAPGYSITMGGDSSCVQFCAYHGTIDVSDISSTKYLYYGIMPDQGGSCAGGCGSDPSTLNNLQSVSSHELVEALTDAAVGVATGSTIAAPIAWYNSANGEIGDLCNAQQATVYGTDGKTYVVQKQWSNSHNGCYAPTGVQPSKTTGGPSKTTTTTTTTPAKTTTTTTTAKTTTKSTKSTKTKTTTTTTTTVAPTPTGLPHEGDACDYEGEYACGDENDILYCLGTWFQLEVCSSGTSCIEGYYYCG
ncbi:uncharacterized protein BJ171DRAFT_629904 [Polychytrium aggregatum]|uniref:uncharacterized protein n=1 Tax=Polychytrium aggregatum TaxID=110093 RepID=UPI0022FDDDA5|nr:uncharacterized protein BJ171DRAFT_629904 [Polychytrium aggregatum]KAI9199778.1 hypothetical protein BJ171DRAFT_629904 [Polychytrium aggregatum]